MTDRQTQASWVKTALRLPQELHQAVHQEARRQDRTFNAQVVATLRENTQAAPKQHRARRAGSAD